MRIFSLFSLAVLVAAGFWGAGSACSADDDPLRDAVSSADAWVSGTDSSQPVRQADGIRFSLPFQTVNADRFYWDVDARLDLSAAQTVRLDVTCPRPDAMRALTLYLESGKGWYVYATTLRGRGRQTLILNRSEFETEGAPAGWNRITKVRLSPWRGAPVDTALTLHRLSAGKETLVVVEGDTSLPNEGERRQASELAGRVSTWLAAAGISHTRIKDRELSRDGLNGATAAILCYTAQLPDAALAAVRKFLDRGGKLIVFYSADARLAEAMGFRMVGYRKADSPLQWTSFSFTESRGGLLPERVYQESGNLVLVQPASQSAKVAAWWESAGGRRTRDPAWLESDSGFWMTHILLRGDDLNKQHLLGGLLARDNPDIARSLAGSALERATQIDSFEDFDALLASLRASKNLHIPDLVNKAVRLNTDLRTAQARGDYGTVMTLSHSLRDTLTEAYARAQPPLSPRFAAVWDHNGVGWTPGDWDSSMKILSENGITAVFANLLWAGLAHYPSDVLPRSDTFRLYGDQLAQISKAGARYGVDVHAWAVLWNLTVAPPAYVEKARSEGRLLMDEKGNPQPWLDPANPDNRAETMAAFRELLTRTPVAGLHLDYIRYPVGPLFYGTTTRAEFEKTLGRRVARWPADVLPDGKDRKAFDDWRADVITSFVREVRVMMRQVRPEAKLSAAVFGGYPDCVSSIGQDWARWLREGFVDFVAPMNYTDNLNRFTHLVSSQTRLPGAAGRICAGIGVDADESSLQPDEVIEQIAAARRLGASGFVLFDLNPGLRDRILPMLRLGLTAPSTAP